MTKIRSIDVNVYRVPLARPVRTSFGQMRDRPGVVVRLKDDDGYTGWGEVFCNWPAAGAEHRARLILEDIAELILGKDWSSPPQMFAELTKATEVKVLQTAEPGPFAQAIAGLDMAMWDIVSQKSNIPMCRALNPDAPLDITAYASGIQIDDAQTMIPEARDKGFRAFKVKIGFDAKADAEKLRAISSSLAPEERLMADANQAWTFTEAAAFIDDIADVTLGWLEEPIRVDCSEHEWKTLAERSHVSLAGGENLLGHASFSAAISAGALSVIQPDVAKWGGVSGCFDVARQALEAGRMYCPHFLGAGIGFIASGHILAAAGGDGMLEIDVNPNPLRSEMIPGWPALNNGILSLPSEPGLGMVPVLNALEKFQTFSGSQSAQN